MHRVPRPSCSFSLFLTFANLVTLFVSLSSLLMINLLAIVFTCSSSSFNSLFSSQFSLISTQLFVSFILTSLCSTRHTSQCFLVSSCRAVSKWLTLLVRKVIYPFVNPSNTPSSSMLWQGSSDSSILLPLVQASSFQSSMISLRVGSLKLEERFREEIGAFVFLGGWEGGGRRWKSLWFCMFGWRNNFSSIIIYGKQNALSQSQRKLTFNDIIFFNTYKQLILNVIKTLILSFKSFQFHPHLHMKMINNNRSITIHFLLGFSFPLASLTNLAQYSCSSASSNQSCWF